MVEGAGGHGPYPLPNPYSELHSNVAFVAAGFTVKVTSKSPFSKGDLKSGPANLSPLF